MVCRTSRGRHCAALKVELEGVAARLAASGGEGAQRMVCAVLDGAANDSPIPELITWGHGFPSLIYFKAGCRTPEILLDPVYALTGPRSCERILAWIRENGGEEARASAALPVSHRWAGDPHGDPHGDPLGQERSWLGSWRGSTRWNPKPSGFEHPRDIYRAQRVAKFEGESFMRTTETAYFLLLQGRLLSVVCCFLAYFTLLVLLLSAATAPLAHDFVSAINGAPAMEYLDDVTSGAHSEFALRVQIAFHVVIAHLLSGGMSSEFSPKPGRFAVFLLVNMQVLIGIVSNVIILAIVLRKIEMPIPTLIFSPVMLVTRRNGELVLLFRLGNLRCNKLISVDIQLLCLYSHRTKEGESIVRCKRLHVSHIPLMYAVLGVEHSLVPEPNSPFYELLANAAEHEVLETPEGKLTFAATVHAHDVVHAEDVHASYSWTPDRIVLARKAEFVFEDVIAPARSSEGSLGRWLSSWFGSWGDTASKPRVDFEKIGKVIPSSVRGDDGDGGGGEGSDTADTAFCFPKKKVSRGQEDVAITLMKNAVAAPAVAHAAAPVAAAPVVAAPPAAAAEATWETRLGGPSSRARVSPYP